MPTPAPYLFPAGARLGTDNVVLKASARRHTVNNYAGPLSIKTVLGGEVTWIIGGRQLVVDPSSFLVVGEGERYSMNLDAPNPVATCCAFFAPKFVDSVALETTTPLAASLDNPARDIPALPWLSAVLTDCDRTLRTRVQGLAPRCRAELSPSAFEEEFLNLATALLGFHEQISEQTARLPAVHETTRKELLRRLQRGREYLHANRLGPVSLHDAARAACLSPFHFHRGFTHAFGDTPHRYLTSLRLEHAYRRLEAGESVLEACQATGFTSPTAFSRLFRTRYGAPPSAVRRKLARSGRKSTSESPKLAT